MRRWLHVSLLLGLILSSCTDGGDDGSDKDVARGPLPDTARAEVWADNRLLVVGSDGAAERGPNDASWQRLPEPPFKSLYGIAASWTGTELVVLGFDCEDFIDDSFCAPGHLVGFRFDGKRWHTIDRSDEPPFASNKAREPAMRVGGWTGSEAVVIADGKLIAVDPHKGRWRTLPATPQVPPNPLCASRHGVVLAHAAARGQGSTMPATASRLNGKAWTSPLPAPLPLPLYARGDCVAGNALILNSTVSEGGNRLDVGEGAMFDAAEGRWRNIPAPPFPVEGAASMASDAEGRLVVADEAGHLYLLNTTTGAWSELPGQLDEFEKVVAITEAGVVTERRDRTLRLLPMTSDATG